MRMNTLLYLWVSEYGMRLGENKLHVRTSLQYTSHLCIYFSELPRTMEQSVHCLGVRRPSGVRSLFRYFHPLWESVKQNDPPRCWCRKKRAFAPPQKLTRHLHMHLLQIWRRDLVNAVRMGPSQLRGSLFSTGPACRCISRTYYWHYHNSGLDNFERWCHFGPSIAASIAASI